jgi:L-ascorbate metabolism protein UlaG (beta-lactamase superfamily)
MRLSPAQDISQVDAHIGGGRFMMEITWQGHSWFEVVTDGVRIDFDPLSEKYQKKLGAIPGPDFSNKADVILVSHSHGDHWDKETIEALRGPGTVIIAPRKPANRLGAGVRVVEAGQTVDLDKVKVRAVAAYNLHKFYHRRGKGVGYLVTVGGRTLYHAGDTDFIPEMSSLGQVDVAFLPIGGRFTMPVDEAALAAKAVSPRLLIPMHCLDTDPAELARLLKDVPSIRVEPMRPGQVLTPKDM